MKKSKFFQSKRTLVDQISLYNQKLKDIERFQDSIYQRVDIVVSEIVEIYNMSSAVNWFTLEDSLFDVNSQHIVLGNDLSVKIVPIVIGQMTNLSFVMCPILWADKKGKTCDLSRGFFTNWLYGKNISKLISEGKMRAESNFYNSQNNKEQTCDS